VFTGAVPFGDRPCMTTVLSIVQGERPLRPTHPSFTADLWTLTQRCWIQVPRLRPEAPEVLRALLALSSDVDRVVKIGTDGEPNCTASDPSTFPCMV